MNKINIEQLILTYITELEPLLQKAALDCVDNNKPPIIYQSLLKEKKQAIKKILKANDNQELSVDFACFVIDKFQVLAKDRNNQALFKAILAKVRINKDQNELYTRNDLILKQKKISQFKSELHFVIDKLRKNIKAKSNKFSIWQLLYTASIVTLGCAVLIAFFIYGSLISNLAYMVLGPKVFGIIVNSGKVILGILGVFGPIKFGANKLKMYYQKKYEAKLIHDFSNILVEITAMHTVFAGFFSHPVTDIASFPIELFIDKLKKYQLFFAKINKQLVKLTFAQRVFVSNVYIKEISNTQVLLNQLEQNNKESLKVFALHLARKIKIEVIQLKESNNQLHPNISKQQLKNIQQFIEYFGDAQALQLFNKNIDLAARFTKKLKKNKVPDKLMGWKILINYYDLKLETKTNVLNAIELLELKGPSCDS